MRTESGLVFRSTTLVPPPTLTLCVPGTDINIFWKLQGVRLPRDTRSIFGGDTSGTVQGRHTSPYPEVGLTVSDFGDGRGAYAEGVGLDRTRTSRSLPSLDAHGPTAVGPTSRVVPPGTLSGNLDPPTAKSYWSSDDSSSDSPSRPGPGRLPPGQFAGLRGAWCNNATNRPNCHCYSNTDNRW